MGLMLPSTDPGRLIITPHPVMLDGQQNLEADLRPGESLYGFLARHVHGLDGQAWLVTIGGRPVERHLWCHVYPKHGQVIEIRGVVGRSAIRLVAMIALTYFTLGGAAIAGFSIGTSTVLGTAIARVAVYVAGSILINKVLGPKLPKAAEITPADTVFSLSAPRNRSRAYEPLPLLFGSVRIAPDVASKPYMNYEGDEQYLSLLLTPGLNVGRVEAIYNGDALLSSYEGVQVWYNGFPGMPNQAIPLYSNAGSVDGGVIYDTSSDPKHSPSKWVQRTSSPGAIRLQVNIDFRIFDADSKGREYENREQIQIQYRAVGESAWRPFGTYAVSGRTQKSRRASYGLDVAPGQYEVQVRTAGQNTDGNNAQASFTWTNLVSVLPDTASYDGIPRIGIRMKASGQLNGSPDEVRTVAHAQPIPVWKGDAIGWVTEESSNPGAQILAYARGIKSPAGVRIAGMGLPDSQIDVEALKAFTLHCAANGFTYDYLVTDKRNHQAVMDAIALAGFGQIAWPKGRLAVTWAADEQPLSGVVNMATIKKGQFQVEYTLANGADGIEYSYLDRATWEARTLRVPAPGVTTMLNPAQVTGEGVTSEAHAATLARWHLAQSLYQYKSISYSTDIEHLAYGRMSVLALQHDLTQWGFGGQVLSATMGPGRAVTLQLDVPVPGRAQASAYIGLRIPGERVYRVLKVVPFTGESDQLQLAEPWPADAALPGDSDGNPAWDTIWIYDFKQTPGYRVRVVSVQPENDLKGAAVDVVAEGPEFWHYVKTGQYIPPENGSQLATRPVASNLRITERQVVQGDTVFSELQASFDITGPVGEIRVLSDLDQNAELEQVASTTARSASWRIPRAGVYPITVRPYSPEGQAGVAATVTYATQGADVPPVLVDMFDVEERSGGIRLYTWGWLGDTTRSADFAGVEIRYMPGKVADPDWNAMTPVGETGYHTAPFEAVIPQSGDWTFACRSVNTSGELSVDARIVMRSLGTNLGEVIGEIGESLEEQTRRQVEQQRQIDQEKLDRINADAAEAQARAAAIAQETAFRVAAVRQVADGLIDANEAIAQEKLDRANAILNEKTERVAAVDSLATTTQSQFESVAQQIGSVAAGSGTQFDSAKIWLFNTTAEGWTSNGTPTVVDGMLRPANSTTAYAQSPAGLAIDSNAYRFIKTRIKRVGTPPWRGLVRWITDADQTWDDTKSLLIAEPSFDANGIATVDISDIPWNGASPIRAVRMALVIVQTAASYLLYDYVAIGRPSPGASVALVQEVQTALQQADQVIASSVTTLGVQMRGQYTGTDPAQLTSGLMYQEMTARVDADKAQVQRIFSMEGRMPTGSGVLASEARVTALEQATTATTNALAQSITTINATLPAMIAQGNNMVINGGWQSGRDVGWTYNNTTLVVAAAEGRAGGAALRADGWSGGVRGATANGGSSVAVSPGKKYRYGCWYKTSADFNGSPGNSKLRLATQSGALIGGATYFYAAKDQWTYVGAVYAVPDSTSITGLQLSVVVDNTVGTVWVDDVVLEEVTDVIANAEGLQALTTTVTNQGGQITAQGNLITALRTDVDGKASNVALQSLQSQVTLQGDDITSLGTAITNVNASLNGLYTRGENLNVNPTFDGTMVPFIKGNTSAANGDVTWFLGAGQQGSAIQFVHKAGATGSPFVYANNGRWTAVSTGPTGRKMRAVVVARVIAGAATLTHRCRVRDGSGESNSDVTTANLTSTWTRYAFEHSIGDSRNEVMSQLWATNRGTSGDATVLVDRIEFYDVTDEVKIDANAAATAALKGTVTQQGQQITAQGTAITTVNAEIARGRNSIWPVGTFESWADGTVLVNNAAGGTNFTVRNAAARNGSRGLEISVTANNSPGSNADMYIGDFIPVSGSRVIYVEFYARLAADSIDNPTGSFGIGVNTQSEAAANSWPRTNDANNTLSKTAWTKRSGYLTLNANSAKMRIFMSIPAANRQVGTIIQIDDVIWQDVTDAQSAQTTAAGAAGGVSALQATVTKQGQDIVAQASKIDGVQASIEGKANASAVVELATRVANQSGAGNKLSASTFLDAVGGTTTGWFLEADTSGAQHKSGYIQGDADPGVPTGMRALIITKGGTSNGTGALIWRNTGDIPVEPGKTYIASVYASGTSGVAFVWVTGGGMEAASIYANKGGGNKLSDYDRLFVKFTAPDNVRSVGFRLAMQPKAADGQQFARFVRPMFEEVSPDQSEPSPWSAGGQESFAGISMFTNVDGHISGIQNKNNGSTSELNFLASAVNILTPGGADGFELTKGYLRVWAGNSQRIIGNNFGADGLVDYFGPNVGAANASKANATMWMDRNGNAYWGGALSAGILRNAAQSTSIQTIGNSTLVGPFDTNGRNKQVVVGYNRRHRRVKSAYGRDGFVAGAGSNGGVINLYRQLNGQSEVLWQQIPITGGVLITNEVDGPDTADSAWNASVTLNDNSDGSTRRSYRAEIVSFTEQTVSHQSGSFDSQTITQSLSIVSIEQ
ncbi:host specificity factor TipJ family phage tail protein [Stenotrophomonas maltophilia]|uniref:host specificity factor TipJ family phage tail protein n=1 Tax=Stenotrophomonas maltophilia TaxID=40324 RepID=UPI001EF7C561|nr:host specificity factor TipJ family phage tail protein [Stenotrophomonas maltophilia]